MLHLPLPPHSSRLIWKLNFQSAEDGYESLVCARSSAIYLSCKLGRIFQFYLYSHIWAATTAVTHEWNDFMLKNVYAFIIIIIILFHETFYDIKFFTLNIQFLSLASFFFLKSCFCFLYPDQQWKYFSTRMCAGGIWSTDSTFIILLIRQTSTASKFFIFPFHFTVNTFRNPFEL